MKFSIAPILWLSVLLLSEASWGASICKSKYTLMHYAQTQCEEIVRPYGEAQTFKIKAMKVLARHPEPESRPTVVLIPGGPGESSNGLRGILQQKELLNAMWSSLQLNVILFDPRGTGESKFPDQTDRVLPLTSETMSFRHLVEDFQAVVDHFQLDQVALFAHSMGAFTALKYAEFHPERVSHLILMSPAASPRVLGRMNLFFGAEDDAIMKAHLAAVSDEEYRGQLQETYKYVSDVTFQQQKSQIIGLQTRDEFEGVSVVQLRKEVLKKLGNIDEPSPDLLQFLVNVQRDFRSVAKGEPLVSMALRQSEIEVSQLQRPPALAYRQIANFLICGETVTEIEKSQNSIYDGLSYGDVRCFRQPKEYRPTLSAPDLSKIRVPTMILSGAEDTQVPLFLQKELADGLSEAVSQLEHIVFENEGHAPGLQDPMRLYLALETFLVGTP